MSAGSYMERRLTLEDLMAQAAAVIRKEPDRHSRALLIERCADTLQAELDRPTDGAYDPGVLRDCFVESAERFLATLDNDRHSVKARPLRVVR